MASVGQQPKLFFYVQHLLGIGHATRAAILARALIKQGFDLYVLFGGEPLAWISFGACHLIQLDPIRAANSRMSGLVDHRGRRLTTSFKASRCQQLLQHLEQIQPDILLIESYPFGRRQLSWELTPLLQTACRQERAPLIVASIRDVQQRRNPQQVQETLKVLDTYFDYVLVHGDANFIALEESFPQTKSIQHKIIYSGYIAETNIWKETGEHSGEVLVSAGGGAVGRALMQAALAAKPQCALSEHTWRFLLGPNMSEADRYALTARQTLHCIFEPIRPDFSRLLSHCALSISQAGYNTVLDILRTGARALLVPFQGGGETEQLFRSRRLEAQGRVVVVPENQLGVRSFSAAIERALMLDTSSACHINMDGATASAQTLWRLLTPG